MKKVALLILSLITLKSINAQTNKFGVKLGSNFNDWYFSFDPLGYTKDFYNLKVGFDIGFIASQKLSDKIGLHEEFYFGVRNAKGLERSAHPSFNSKVIAIPLTLSYSAYKKIGIDIGGEYARLIHSKSQYYPLENKNYFSALGGVRYTLSPKMSFYAHYNYNFSNIFHIKYVDVFGVSIGPTNLKNFSFNLACLYYFKQ